MKPVTIIGGGLAGLTLGIGLRQRDVPVTIWEAGHYPRHRVCGEFISGNGQAVLERLGLRSQFEKAGAIPVRTVQFIAGRNQSPIREVPPAIGFSRYDMDHLLAEKFKRLGGELRAGERWTARSHNTVGQAFQPAGSRSFPASSSSFARLPLKQGAGKSPEPAGWKACPTEEGIVRASGRRPHPTENGYRWFGLKVHARNVALQADLEMHISSNSYIGVNRINNGEVNVCGLFRGRPNGRAALPRRQNSDKAKPGDISAICSNGDLQAERQLCPTDLLRGEPGSLLHEHLEKAVFDESSFCSVAGLSLKPHRATEKDELCIGDALTMIPPVTGNGMSMAFESAELAIEPLTAHSQGKVNWREAHQAIVHACDAAFTQRLRWARWLQALMFSPVAQNRFGLLLMRSETFWDLMFTKTR